MIVADLYNYCEEQIHSGKNHLKDSIFDAFSTCVTSNNWNSEAAQVWGCVCAQGV